MPNYFYFDQANQKWGPVSEQQICELAACGIISQHTPMETDDGHKGLAGQIPGLFADLSPSAKEFTHPNTSLPVSVAIQPDKVSNDIKDAQNWILSAIVFVSVSLSLSFLFASFLIATGLWGNVPNAATAVGVLILACIIWSIWKWTRSLRF